MKKLLPAIDIVIYIVVIGWFVQKYFKNGFKDLTDFIIPSVVSMLFIYDLYSLRKKKSEKPKETQLREDKAFFEIKYAAVISIDSSIIDKKIISKIVLCDLQKIIYPKVEKIFLELIRNAGYPEIKFDKIVDFEKMYNDKFN